MATNTRTDKKIKEAVKLVHEIYAEVFSEHGCKFTRDEKTKIMSENTDNLKKDWGTKQRSAYQQFVSDNFAKVSKDIDSDNLGEVNHAINEKWHGMSEKAQKAFKKKCGIEEKIWNMSKAKK